MHVLAKLLKLTAWLASFLLAVVALTLLAIWWKPERLLNERNVSWAISRFAPHWKVEWEKFHWSFSPRGALGKDTALLLHDLCVRGPGVDACLPELALDLGFSIDGFSPRVTELRNLVVRAGKVRIETGGDTAQEPPSSPLPDLRVPRLGSLLPPQESLSKLGVLELSVEELELAPPDGPPLRAAARLVKPGREEPRFALVASLRQGKALAWKLDASATLENRQLEASGLVSGRASGLRLRAPFSADWGEELRLRLEPRLDTGGKRYRGKLALSASDSALGLEATSLRLPLSWRSHRLAANGCALTARLHEEKGYPEHSELHCSLHVSTTAKSAPVKEATVALEASTELGLGGNSVHADLDFTARSSQRLFRAKVEGGGRLNFDHAWRFTGVTRPRLTADASIPRFSAVRGLLAGSPWAVPAPFHVLEGEIALAARLEASEGDLLPFRVSLRTNLTGGGQSVVTETSALVQARGVFAGKPAFDVEAEAKLSDVALEAPPLRLESPPQATLDKRFGPRAPPAPKGENNVRWRAHVTSGKPVRIRASLLPEPLPFAVDLRLAHDHRPAGTVTLLPVPVEIFKKRARVEKVVFTLRESSEAVELDGLLIYRNPEALVRILLLGQASEPRVVLQSEPPLSESQIVSLLLFNKSVQELNEEEASSSASMGQALSDGAFGLFTLMFLSSTPIESVGYDPVSDSYSVRVRLGDRTTVSVASDFQGERQYAIRRRIGKRWAVTSELQREEDEGSSSLLTLLEWFNRF